VVLTELFFDKLIDCPVYWTQIVFCARYRLNLYVLFTWKLVLEVVFVDFSSWGPGFDPGLVHVRFVVGSVALGQVLCEFFGFFLSVTLHRFFILLSKHVGEAGEPSNEVLGRKISYLHISVQPLCLQSGALRSSDTVTTVSSVVLGCVPWSVSEVREIHNRLMMLENKVLRCVGFEKQVGG
jgi:hypothetical protein